MKKSKRLAIMLKHRELVRSGKLEVAKHLLTLLIKHEAVLGIGDSSFEAELIVEKLGCHIRRPNHWAYVIAFDYC